MTDAAKGSPKNFIRLAADAAAELKSQCEGQPEMEFLAWLRIALNREAMVSVVYDPAFVGQQLTSWQLDRGIPDAVVSAVQNAISGVWAQEEMHQRYFAVMLKSIYRQKTLRQRLLKESEHIRGKIEGAVLARIRASVLSWLPPQVRR